MTDSKLRRILLQPRQVSTLLVITLPDLPPFIPTLLPPPPPHTHHHVRWLGWWFIYKINTRRFSAYPRCQSWLWEPYTAILSVWGQAGPRLTTSETGFVTGQRKPQYLPTWSSLVFWSWLAYSFLLSSICCLLMLEFIRCFSTSALQYWGVNVELKYPIRVYRDRLRSASALLYASKAFSLAPNAFSYFSLVLARVVRDSVSWAWIRAPSCRNWNWINSH